MSVNRQIRSHAAMRGIAALLVVGYHLQFGASYRLAAETSTAFLSRGYLWVDLFFVLSGFIISYVNNAERRSIVSRADALGFLRSRLIRLYPLHLACLAALVCVTMMTSILHGFGHNSSITTIDYRGWLLLAAQVLLVNAWSVKLAGWNIPSWSISAELLTYAAFPLMVSAHASFRRLTEVAMLGIPVVFFGYVAVGTGSLDVIAGPFAILRCLSGFCLGMLAYMHRRRCSGLGPQLLGVCQLGCILAIILLVASPVNDALLPPLFVLLVWSSWTDSGPLPWLIARRPLLWLGEISYSIYLTHVPILKFLGFFWFRLQIRIGLEDDIKRLMWLVLAVSVILVTSRMTFEYIERPASKWLTRRWTGRRNTSIASEPAAP